MNQVRTGGLLQINPIGVPAHYFKRLIVWHHGKDYTYFYALNIFLFKKDENLLFLRHITYSQTIVTANYPGFQPLALTLFPTGPGCLIRQPFGVVPDNQRSWTRSPMH
jgi:hypothetical protein